MRANPHEPNMVLGLARRRRSQLILPAVVLAFLFLVFQRTLKSGSSIPLLPTDHQVLQFKASSVNWAGAQLFFPPGSMTRLPTDRPKTLPRVQATGELFKETEETQYRRQVVKDVFSRSWNAYKEQAWAWDEVRPVTGGGKNTFGGWAATLVDSLDTLWIMGCVNPVYSISNTMADFQNLRATAYMTTFTKLHRLRLS
jgi:mannosyl-oligosaccharide alpha-1,2-mannosidase